MNRSWLAIAAATIAMGCSSWPRYAQTTEGEVAFAPAVENDDLNNDEPKPTQLHNIRLDRIGTGAEFKGSLSAFGRYAFRDCANTTLLSDDLSDGGAPDADIDFYSVEIGEAGSLCAGMELVGEPFVSDCSRTETPDCDECEGSPYRWDFVLFQADGCGDARIAPTNPQPLGASEKVEPTCGNYRLWSVEVEPTEPERPYLLAVAGDHGAAAAMDYVFGLALRPSGIEDAFVECPLLPRSLGEDAP